MNVFILSTGRCGSTTFAQACKHITNYSSAHESKNGLLCEERLNYPDQHIEVDNRLSWMLGTLDEQYGQDAYYVHLIRSKEPTVQSYLQRWRHKESLVLGFTNGILQRAFKKMTETEREEAVGMLYDHVNANIRLFLRDKAQQCTIVMEEWSEDFIVFWNDIDAQGDINDALATLNKVHNDNKKYTAWVERNRWHRSWTRRMKRMFNRLTGNDFV